jgi:hypothetical protein
VLVAEEFLTEVDFYRTWVEFPFFFDHAPICLKLDLKPVFKNYPFKFNAHWLEDTAFVDLVAKIWNDPAFVSERNVQRRLIWKLHTLKLQTKIWYKEKNKRNKARLTKLDADIKVFINLLTSDTLKKVVESSLRWLEVERNALLLQEENKWRLSRRATWLASGDANTKYFHNFASHNRVKKFIWDMKGADGNPVNEDFLLKKEVVTSYKKLYKESICHNTAEHYTLIKHFPQMIKKTPEFYSYRLLWKR